MTTMVMNGAECLTDKRYITLFQSETLSEIIIIANLRRVWVSPECDFRLCWINLCTLVTTASRCHKVLKETRVCQCEWVCRYEFLRHHACRCLIARFSFCRMKTLKSHFIEGFCKIWQLSHCEIGAIKVIANLDICNSITNGVC